MHVCFDWLLGSRIVNEFVHCVSFKKIWHLGSQQTSTFQHIKMAEAAKQWMETATLTLSGFL